MISASYKNNNALFKYYVKIIIETNILNISYLIKFVEFNLFYESILYKDDFSIILKVGIKNVLCLKINIAHSNYDRNELLKVLFTLILLLIILKISKLD